MEYEIVMLNQRTVTIDDGNALTAKERVETALQDPEKYPCITLKADYGKETTFVTKNISHTNTR